ncbi:MAG: hypothetical protein WC389_17410 [Lutibacter sp.]|jgi:hypothetical protein
MMNLKKQQIKNLFGASIISFDIDNFNLTIPWIILLLVILLLVVIIIYKSNTAWGFKLRKYIKLSLSINKESEIYKKQARILFIDDRDIPIADTLADDKWVVEKVRDAQVDDEKVKNANIIFVDWKGVGRKISSEAEGMALVENLKRKYGYKKYIILYSAREYQKPEGALADDWINKGSPFSTYSDTIKRASFALFG